MVKVLEKGEVNSGKKDEPRAQFYNVVYKWQGTGVPKSLTKILVNTEADVEEMSGLELFAFNLMKEDYTKRIHNVKYRNPSLDGKDVVLLMRDDFVPDLKDRGIVEMVDGRFLICGVQGSDSGDCYYGKPYTGEIDLEIIVEPERKVRVRR